jgi:predicted unusual protein kinase regulating ubiquinone biosynthesis (AarF/ABC1/UbiB family)
MLKRFSKKDTKNPDPSHFASTMNHHGASVSKKSFMSISSLSHHHLKEQIANNPSYSSSKLPPFKMRKMAETIMQQKMNQNVETEQLKLEIQRLSSTCKCLEAQNIIAAAQMVDFIAVSIGNICSLVSYVLYQKLLWWIASLLGSTFAISCIKWVLLFIPYVYNKKRYGVIHRRFHVFAVAFVMIVRIKLTRWRVNTFVSNSKSERNKGDKDTDESRNNSDVSSSNYGYDITEDDIWDANYEINARFLYSSILRLKGLWTKTAQYLSSRADFVPIPYVRELSKLQDEAPVSDWKDIQLILAKNGILDKLTVEPEPIASASIGQVHVAYLKESYGSFLKSNKVVVKVQHPHADTLLSDDFISLRIIARIISILEPEYKFFEILMNEWANESIHELDFNKEFENLVSAGEAIESMEKSTPMNVEVKTDGSDCHSIPFSVEIPKPFKHLTSRHVLVMTFSDGVRVDDSEMIAKCNVPREAIMSAIAQANAYMMYCSEIFSGDLHPGNVFLRPGLINGEQFGFTIIILDWGLAKRLPEEKRIGFCQMTYGAATFDFGLIMDAFKTLGLKMKRENVSEDMSGIRFLLRDMAPRDIARQRVKSKMKSDKNAFASRKKGERVPIESDAYPGEFFFFVRTNELLHGLGSRLGVHLTYLDILKPFALAGLKKASQYKRNLTIPDPLLEEKIADFHLQQKIEKVLNGFECLAGAQVCVLDRDGHTLAHSIIGHLGSVKSHLHMRSDSLVLGFSVTKATAATLVHAMVEDGYMSYDEPICKRIWPEFCPFADPPPELIVAMDGSSTEIIKTWEWKRKITLRHVLTHTSGLWSATPSNLTIQKLSSCQLCTESFEYKSERPEETLLPTHEPGTECVYHPLSFGWLVAGCVTGAYYLKHGINLTYEEVFDRIISPRLSESTKKSGFHPCGGDQSVHDLAFFDAEVDLSRLIQMKREAEEMGESFALNENGKSFAEGGSSKVKELMSSIKGREFLLDVRIWNSQDALCANVPSAGGRFSAKGLASFYHDLGSGRILSRQTFETATTAVVEEKGLQELQGQTVFSSNNSGNTSSKSAFALGYQLFELPKNVGGRAFGHAGVGGSLGLFHVESGVSVAIMFNKAPKANGDKAHTKQILEVIAKHLKW